MTEARQTHAWLGWLPLPLFVFAVLAVGLRLVPWAFMWLLSITIFFGLKWLTWWKAPTSATSWARSLAYLFAWPGMDVERFMSTARKVDPPSIRAWFMAVLKTAFGALIFWQLARRVPASHPLLQGWAGMVGLIFLLHFGSFDLLAQFWRWRGIDATPIMDRPHRSASLSEFWGKRWNLGFRQFAYDLVFVPLRARKASPAAISFAIFLLSGLIHDLVISLPARGGYGLPTLYFVIQGVGVWFERSKAGRAMGLGSGAAGWLFMALVTIAPAGLLFHRPFILNVIIPFMKAVHAL